MTSANVTEYRICDLAGNVVGNHRQHHYCKPRWNELERYQPPENFTITPHGQDEEENDWERETVNLKVFLDRGAENKRKADASMALWRSEKAQGATEAERYLEQHREIKAIPYGDIPVAYDRGWNDYVAKLDAAGALKTELRSTARGVEVFFVKV